MEQTDIITQLQASDFTIDPEQKWQIIVHETIAPIEARLTKVMNHIPREGNFRDGFSLTFVTDLKDKYYLQGNYQLIHPQKGALLLFMVPIGPDKEGFIQYEIIFT